MTTDLVLPNKAPIKPSRETLSIPAAYALHHDKSGKVYVGSTGNLYARMSRHRTDLKRGVHKNSNLQSAFNDDPSFSLSYLPTDTKEKAIEVEQSLLDQHLDSGILLNIASDATNPGAGVIISDEQKEKLRIAALNQFSDPDVRREHSEKTKRLWQDPVYRQSHSGRVLSEDSRNKSSKSVKMNWQDPTYRERNEAHLKSPEHRALLVAAVSKPVVIDGVTYPSNAEAARKLGIKDSTLRARIKRNKLKPNQGETP